MPESALKITEDLNLEADRIRAIANTKIDEKKRGKLGQFMSSFSVSSLLASMFEGFSPEEKLLDAGAGVGSLTSAVVNEAMKSDCKRLGSTCYEISEELHPYLTENLAICSERAPYNNLGFRAEIIKKDFIASSIANLKSPTIKRYSKAILNPPYLKIGAKSEERALLRSVEIETGNLYSAFVALAIKQLEKGGELVAITPRSFCNGPYFNDFRKLLLNECSLNKLHVFHSRKSAFKVDKVLQENVIYHLTKGEPQREMVTIVSSSCAEDPSPVEYQLPFEEVVQPRNPHRFIHIITNEEEREIANKAGNLPCGLEDLGIQASTGKVVDFRTRENLSQEYVPGSVPLIFPQHMRNGVLTWPSPEGKKPNALLHNEKTESLMVPNGTYVLTRRLTAKEERRRLTASIYTPDTADVPVVGFENKTNYFHANGEPLEENLARGLWLFLNSTIVDLYFRQLNGHTQVNATDLRSLRYPSREMLTELAHEENIGGFEQKDIDNIVERIIFNEK